MNKISSYVMISERIESEFEATISHYMNEGYQPYGNPFIRLEYEVFTFQGKSEREPVSEYCQAMVKYE